MKVRRNQVNYLVYRQGSKTKQGWSVGKTKILFDFYGQCFLKNYILHSNHRRKHAIYNFS